MKCFYFLLLILLSQVLTAQSITLTTLQGNNKSTIIKENNIIYLKYKTTPNDIKPQKIQGRLITVTDSNLVVKPLFSKEALTINTNQIIKIKKGNLIVLSLGTAALTAGTFFLLENLNKGGQANLFFSLLIAPSVFLLTWDNLLNPMNNVAPHYYTKNNQWIIKLNE